MRNKEYKAILIDVESRDLIPVTIQVPKSLQTLQALVGGYIEVAHYLQNGDLIYVSDDIVRGASGFFHIEGAHQPFSGNGVVVCGEEYADVLSTIEGLKAKIKFYDINQIRNMLKAA